MLCSIAGAIATQEAEEPRSGEGTGKERGSQAEADDADDADDADADDEQATPSKAAESNAGSNPRILFLHQLTVGLAKKSYGLNVARLAWYVPAGWSRRGEAACLCDGVYGGVCGGVYGGGG